MKLKRGFHWLAVTVFAVMVVVCGITSADSTSGGAATTQPATAPAANGQKAVAGFDSMLTGDWLGWRRKLADGGVSVGGSLVLEGFDNFRGGLDTAHAVGSTTLDLNVTLDLEKLLIVRGGTVYCDLEDHAFRNPTTALTGDLQVFDKTNAPPYLEIFELWYQQTLFDGKLRLKIGKVDANTEFCLIDNGLQFINSSSQLSPTIFVMPTTPNPMPSVNAFFTPVDWYFASIGAYYANRSDRFGDIVDDPALAQLSRYGAFLIGETGFQWRAMPVFGFAGNLKFGTWGHTGTFQRLDGTLQAGTEGGYAVFNQTLYQPAGESKDGRGMRMFLEYGATEPEISRVDQHIGAGWTLTGPTESRAQDVVGISAQYAQISHGAGLVYPYELAIEGFYQVQVTPWMQVQPDLQYIVHPGGQFRDALVGTVRCTIQF